MSVDTLLDDAINDGKTTLQIDEKTRAISYSGGSLLLGVEGDIDSHRLYFELPSESVGDDITLGADTVHIYIDFINAEYTTCICEASNKLVVDGTTTFDWLLDKRVAICDGKVEFRVRITDTATDGNVREWHTAIFSATVLDGIDVDDKTPEVVTETSSFYKMTQEMNSLRADVEAAVQEANQAVIDVKNITSVAYEKVSALKDYLISDSEYTDVDAVLEEGYYTFKIELTSLGRSVDLEHNYTGEHIFRGRVYSYADSTNTASVLYSNDIICGYDSSLSNGVFCKLALILKHLETSTRVSIVAIQNPYATPSYDYCTGTITQVYKETLS